MPEGLTPKRIEICGGIASGKTTLAHLLADGSDYALVLENFRANPFWARFYQNPQQFAAEKNICFLPQHTGEIKDHAGPGLLVCDYAVFQDLAYASLCAASGHLEVMRGLFEHLYRPLPAPSLIVQLACDPAVQLERIRARARDEEQGITLDYLDALNRAIPEFLRQTLPAPTRVLELHSDEIDLAQDAAARAAIRQQILALVHEGPVTP